MRVGKENEGNGDKRERKMKSKKVSLAGSSSKRKVDSRFKLRTLKIYNLPVVPESLLLFQIPHRFQVVVNDALGTEDGGFVVMSNMSHWVPHPLGRQTTSGWSKGR